MRTFAQTGTKSLISSKQLENFKKENLVAWCIGPFDAMNRSPKQRAEMLVAHNVAVSMSNNLKGLNKMFKDFK